MVLLKIIICSLTLALTLAVDTPAKPNPKYVNLKALVEPAATTSYNLWVSVRNAIFGDRTNIQTRLNLYFDAIKGLFNFEPNDEVAIKYEGDEFLNDLSGYLNGEFELIKSLYSDASDKIHGEADANLFPQTQVLRGRLLDMDNKIYTAEVAIEEFYEDLYKKLAAALGEFNSKLALPDKTKIDINALNTAFQQAYNLVFPGDKVDKLPITISTDSVRDVINP